MSNEPNIEVVELRGKKRITFRGMKNLQRSDEELQAWVDEYGQGLIAIDDAIEDYEGLEQWWQIGRAVEDAVEDSEGRAELAKLTRHSGLGIDEYTMKRYQNFYQMFPERDYDPDVPRSIYTELAIGQRLEAGRKAYDRMSAFDGSPRVYEVRAWGKCFEADDFSLPNIVHNVIEEGKTQTNELDSEKILEGTRWVVIMSGGDANEVSYEQVKEVILGEVDGDFEDILFTYDKDEEWRYIHDESDGLLHVNVGHHDWREAKDADEEEKSTENRNKLITNFLIATTETQNRRGDEDKSHRGST